MTDKDRSAAKTEIERLVQELNYHSYRYHVLDEPIISDAEYDRKYRQLKELEERYDYVLPESPTQRVGAPASEKFDKIKHSEPMLSLDNAFSLEEMREFDRKLKKFLDRHEEIEYTVEPKYDGLAMELTYRNGLLLRASTRGDGYEGEDATRNIRTIRSVPLKIDGTTWPEEIDIRGEVYMDIDEFEELNRLREKKGEPFFGGFDERFFLYYEEVGLCRRMVQAGYEVWYWPDIVITHIGGACSKTVKTHEFSSAGSQLTLWWRRRARLYYRKHHRPLAAWGLAGVESLWHRLRIAANAGNPAKHESSRRQIGLVRQAWTDTAGGALCPPRPW